jgi:hypothetical protein
MNCLNCFAMLASTLLQWMVMQKKEKAHKIALKMGIEFKCFSISKSDGPYGKPMSGEGAAADVDFSEK